MRGRPSMVLALVAGFLTVLVGAGTVSARTLASKGTATPCPGVRPGAHVQTSMGTGGTLNFLFRGSDGHRYIATAGHLLADEQTLVWNGDGPEATIDDGTHIGRAVFAWNYNAMPADFALIKLANGID